jgi:hypothetical protein
MKSSGVRVLSCSAFRGSDRFTAAVSIRQRHAAYAHGSNVARPEADAGVQESLLAEQRELGNDLAERRVRSAWSGKATGRDSVNATISMRMDFLVGTPET